MKSSQKYILFIYLLSPLLALLSGLSSADIKIKKFSVIIFFTIYGSIAFFPEGSDATRHLLGVTEHYFELNFFQFVSEFISLLVFKPMPGINNDVFIHVLSYLAGLFNYPRLLYILVSIIYGFFFTSSIFKIFEKLDSDKFGFFLIFFFVYFIFWKNVEGINSIRNHTGAWVLFYGAINYFDSRKNIYLLFVLLSISIHVQYLLISIPVFIVSILRIPPFVYIFILVASFFVVIPQSSVIDQFTLSEIGDKKVNAYVKSDEYFNEKNLNLQKNLNSYAYAVRGGFIFEVITGILVLLLVNGNYSKSTSYFEFSFMSVGILMVSLANVLDFIPAVYSRIFQNAGLYILSSFLILLNSDRIFTGGHLPKFLINIILIGLTLSCSFILIFKLSVIISFTSVFLLGFPAFPLIFQYINLSIREALDWFL